MESGIKLTEEKCISNLNIADKFFNFFLSDSVMENQGFSMVKCLYYIYPWFSIFSYFNHCINYFTIFSLIFVWIYVFGNILEFYNFLIFESIRFLQRWTDVKQFERLLNPEMQISAIKNWQDILIIFGKLLSFQGHKQVMKENIK